MTYEATSEEIESARELLVKAGFPAQDWSAEEIQAKWLALIDVMRDVSKAIASAFQDLAGRFGETFRRLAVIAEEIERGEA